MKLSWISLLVVVLLVVSLALIAALAFLGSLVLPKAVNVVLLILLLVVGNKLITFVRARTLDTSYEKAAEWFSAYLPNFSHLNLTTRYTDGIGPLASAEFLGLVFYGAVFIAVSLLLGILVFNRRSL